MVAFDSHKNGYYYSEISYQLPYVSVSEGECVALFLAERLLQQYQGTAFAADITRLFNKVVDSLSEPITINLQHLSEMVSFRQQATDLGDIQRFEQLHRATREGRQLEIVYWTASRDETCRRVVDPYHLGSVYGDWYLIAYCHRREDVLMLVRRPEYVKFARPATHSSAQPISASTTTSTLASARSVAAVLHKWYAFDSRRTLLGT